MVPQALTCPLPSATTNFGGAYVRPAVKYTIDERFIGREAAAGQFASTSSLAIPTSSWLDHYGADLGDVALGRLWNLLELEGQRPRFYRGSDRSTVNIVDLFCGCGGLSLGVKRAAEAVGARPIFLLAVDVAESALSVYMRNLRPLRNLRQNIRTLVDYSHGGMNEGPLIDVHRIDIKDEIMAVAGEVDILLAGPPCQGNSNLNNRTRRTDRRNELYLDAVVIGIAVDAKVIVIENVPAVTHSRQNVVSRSLRLLKGAGYRIEHNEFALTASDFGTPQERRRHFLIAGKSARAVSTTDLDTLKVLPPTVKEALSPLVSIDRHTTFDCPSELSPENRKRVEFLVDRQEYDLPDEERPDCHRLKPHSYPSVYGRMRPNQVAPTITTGFLSPGRGRFTHPFEARSLTPREGARLQGFGENFDWLCRARRIGRGDYAGMIGAAVPPQLGFVVGMCALSIL